MSLHQSDVFTPYMSISQQCLQLTTLTIWYAFTKSTQCRTVQMCFRLPATMWSTFWTLIYFLDGHLFSGVAITFQWLAKERERYQCGCLLRNYWPRRFVFSCGILRHDTRNRKGGGVGGSRNSKQFPALIPARIAGQLYDASPLYLRLTAPDDRKMPCLCSSLPSTYI